VYDDARKLEAMKEAFYQLAGDDKVIDAYELKAILNAAFKKGRNNYLSYYHPVKGCSKHWI
jgi:hypothetical protein